MVKVVKNTTQTHTHANTGTQPAGIFPDGAMWHVAAS